MVRSEFEEKEYENPLYIQLLEGNNNLWTPGQVFEGHFGIDAALEVYRESFWEMMGYRYPLRGVVIDNFRWGFIWKSRKKRQLPTFNTNLLIQAKPCEYLNGRNSNLAALGIKGAYFRFSIKEHQQKALEAVSNRLGNKAVVSYACPAFYTYNDLFQYTSLNTMIENSTFVKVKKLNGHVKWAFDSPGTNGVAYSIPKKIIDKEFNAQISELSQSNYKEEFNNQKAEISLIHLENNLSKMLYDEELSSNPIIIEVKRIYNKIDNTKVYNEEFNGAIKSYIRVKILMHLLNVNWYVVGA